MAAQATPHKIICRKVLYWIQTLKIIGSIKVMPKKENISIIFWKPYSMKIVDEERTSSNYERSTTLQKTYLRYCDYNRSNIETKFIEDT